MMQEKDKYRWYWSGYVWVVILSMLSISAQAQVHCTISGFFPKTWEGKQAMVVAKPLHGPPIIDTTTIGNRTATFTIDVAEPSPAYLWVDGNPEDIHFFIDSPKINIGVDGTISQPLVMGSASSEPWASYVAQRAKGREDLHDLQLESFTALRIGDSLVAFKLDQLADSIQLADDEQLINLIEANPRLAFGWYLFASNHLPYAKTVQLFGKLSSFSSYPSYQEISARLSRIQLGKKAPDFTLKNPSDSVLTLTKIAGKYILLDFTISHLAPHQKRELDMVKLYRKYHPLGLEIVTVSLEFNRKADRQSGILDPLPWIQLSDSPAPTSTLDLFGVGKLPTTVLLDANKVMIDRELSIHDLDRELAKLLK